MKENPSRVSSRQQGTHEEFSGGPTRRKRYTVDESGDLIECSGKHCQSCAAVLIADCVAICCCPCALVNFFALAFVKFPWMMGRRCFGRLKARKKKKKKLKEMKRNCKEISNDHHHDQEAGRDGKFWRNERTEEGFSEITSGFGEEDQDMVAAGVSEAERVWLELYQIGHLGFGRVSFTGIQYKDSIGKMN